MRPFLAAMAAAILVGGCATTTETRRAADSPGPALVVERFLQAANANDLVTMATLFGTPEKTISELEGSDLAQRRMYLLASLLRHNDFSIQGQRVVPGRLHDATELMVELHKQGRRVVVPHLVVRRSDGGWIIEKIEVEKLTSSEAG